ncbi:type I-C CRISPR-associated protein Cas7/Csd2 [Cereibacter sphaeroides]|uniref:type I-C CRISPR-associated protein Cas7/Csd2 n=1 Tax=Cereibacter sphaeroides TaxID=1063 RepID=UPI000F520025|nr:type I-C CRISPR-associated protein Cas7/Csd2 [Cereibacter sphaeroides]AZB54623.1 type I-C CRISPR-associated protein Cas7/Csd2 [Cereibacter sphaeroides]AZB58879.1 type I-C CRISPR-associated protein Cas7/Csd2 [Cereibacter sphaeroides]MWP35993.1 type I-C CRISPR-associated protein Cas7/Csd2 [Cereibacter sphaeroides]
MTALTNRYEFVFLFDIRNGNPNGDPDNGNMPRIDTDTEHGLVTDVALKRKIRNYVDLKHGGEPPHAIYMREKAILNATHGEAYAALGLKPESKKLPKDEAKAREITRWMCQNFYDIRTFGAVMTTDVNAGQVRGPVQLSFSETVDPILPQEITITRSSVTNEKDAAKERTMGRKYIVPYGLYRCHGFVSASLAGDATKGTGFSEEDLALLFEALTNMFEHDRSAARMEMNAQRLIVFRHDSALGNAPAQALFKRVAVARRDDVKVPRRFEDYDVAVDTANLPTGVEIRELF